MVNGLKFSVKYEERLSAERIRDRENMGGLRRGEKIGKSLFGEWDG